MATFHSYQTDDEHLPKHQKADPHLNGQVFCAYGDFAGYNFSNGDRVTMVRLPRDAVPMMIFIVASGSGAAAPLAIGNKDRAAAYDASERRDRSAGSLVVPKRDAPAIGGDGYLYLTNAGGAVNQTVNMRVFYTVGKSYAENAGD